MATWAKWSDEQVGYLRELFDEGASASQSAEAMMARFGGTVTRNAVIGKWNLLGLANTRGRVRKPTRQKSETPKAPKPKAVAPIAPVVVRKQEPPVAIPRTGRVTLFDLGAFDCRFPLGDPRDADFGYCGAAARIGSSYCREHHALCYQPLKFRDEWDKRIHRQARRAA